MGEGMRGRKSFVETTGCTDRAGQDTHALRLGNLWMREAHQRKDLLSSRLTRPSPSSSLSFSCSAERKDVSCVASLSVFSSLCFVEAEPEEVSLRVLGIYLIDKQIYVFYARAEAYTRRRCLVITRSLVRCPMRLKNTFLIMPIVVLGVRTPGKGVQDVLPRGVRGIAGEWR